MPTKLKHIQGVVKMKIKLTLATAALAAICLMQPALAATKESKADLFAKIDTDGNGKISKEEWLAYSTAQFKKMCDDGDNEITKSEWNVYQAK